jgi:hypothetical protein
MGEKVNTFPGAMAAPNIRAASNWLRDRALKGKKILAPILNRNDFFSTSVLINKSGLDLNCLESWQMLCSTPRNAGSVTTWQALRWAVAASPADRF